MTPRKLIIIAALAPLTLISAECLTESDQGTITSAILAEVLPVVNEVLNTRFDAPPEACSGAVICRSRSNEPLVCHECEKICDGKRLANGGWQSDDAAACPPKDHTLTREIQVSVSALSVGSADAKVNVKIEVDQINIQKRALGDPTGATGQNPDEWVREKANYLPKVTSLGTIRVTWPGGSANVSDSFSEDLPVIERCRFEPGAQVCGPVGTPDSGSGIDADPGGSTPGGDTPPG